MAAGEDTGFRALERGLEVIKFFTDREKPATISDVARGTGLDRAVARRILLALKQLSYVNDEDGRFSLQPTVLELGYAYLSSDPLPAIADARLGPLSRRLEESCSLGVLRNGRVIYLSTMQFRRVAGPTLTVGTMSDPHMVSIGRVVLAYLPEAERDRILDGMSFVPTTPHTITDRDAFLDELHVIREQGWSLVAEEMELGLLALAVPVRGPAGDVVAASNVTTHTSRASRASVVTQMLPELRQASSEIELDLRHIRRL